MLHVLLLILKIIGYLLLAVLGLLLLLVLIVLFVPMRYEICGSSSGKLDSICAQTKLSWLLHLVSVHLVFRDKALSWKLRIAFIKRRGGAESEGNDASGKKSQEDAYSGTDGETIKEQEEYEALKKQLEDLPDQEHSEGRADQLPEKRNADSKADELPCKKPAMATEKESSTAKEPAIEMEKERGAASEQKKTASVFTRLLEKIKQLWEKIKYTYDKICGKINVLSGKKELLTSFVGEQSHQSALRRTIREIRRLLKFVLPKKFHADIHYGLDDPYLTGKILAGLSMIYPWTGDNLKIEPDFTMQVLEGEVFIRGHIRVIYFIVIVWNLFWDKNIRRTIKDFKSIKEQI